LNTNLISSKSTSMKNRYTRLFFPNKSESFLCTAFLLVFSFFISGDSLAQTRTHYRKIVTREVHERLMRENPEVTEARHAIEQQTARFQKSGSTSEVTIPVVFHIVYHTEQERVNEDQVRSQLEALNRDFNHVNREIHHPADTLEGFAEKAANPGISFCLAATDANAGNFSPGIHYVRSQRPVWTTDEAIKYAKNGGTDAVDPKHCLNIWVTRLDDNASGYAQMPGGPAVTDGIVIDYRFFGTRGTALPPYDEGKTLTHLVGNYLNLFDLWGTGFLCSDDYVEDTPIHNAPNHGCPGYRHISTCRDNPVEMTMNFMDNTDDACMYMFTQGQVMRMHAVLSERGIRSGLAGQTSLCTPSLEERSDDVTGNNPGTKDPQGGLSLTVFPNPASGKIQLLIFSGIEGPSVIAVFNSLGAVVHTVDLDLYKGEQQMTFDCHSWAEGSYYVKVQSSREIVSRLFFIKNN
jgi:hypothetical protein